MKSYVNAKDVLPEGLFIEIKKYYNSGLLYVEKGNDSGAKRKLVIALWKQRTPAKEISLISGLSTRRVHQIIAQKRRENAFFGCRNK